VLVIDDEADIRELLELSLLRMGLAVECSGSVVAAKQLLQSKRYDLCLPTCACPTATGWSWCVSSAFNARSCPWR